MLKVKTCDFRIQVVEGHSMPIKSILKDTETGVLYVYYGHDNGGGDNSLDWSRWQTNC